MELEHVKKVICTKKGYRLTNKLPTLTQYRMDFNIIIIATFFLDPLFDESEINDVGKKWKLLSSIKYATKLMIWGAVIFAFLNDDQNVRTSRKTAD